jgi:tryptophan synthase alpha chain
MNRIRQTFDELKCAGKKAFIPYIMGGDPGLTETARLIELLAASGANLIEVGVPFSDPLADGPVIQQAGIRSLQNGCTLEKLLQTLKTVTTRIKTPVILMIYYNMILKRGVEQFVAAAADSGCSGLIIPDLPSDEAASMIKLADQYSVGLNFLVAPTSKDQRIALAAEVSTGFLYAVSLKGVTGMRDTLPPELPDFVNRVKKLTSGPVAVGFGISTPEQARTVAGLADGVIIGSAMVKAVAADPSMEAARKLAAELRAGIGS